MLKRNMDIRQAKGKIPNWVIGERLEISETTFVCWMRKEMDAEKKERIMSAIDAIKADLEEYGVKKITKDSKPAVV